MKKLFFLGFALAMILFTASLGAAQVIRLDPVSEVIPWECFTAECDQRNVACTVPFYGPIVVLFDTSDYIGAEATLHYTTGMNTYQEFGVTYQVLVDGTPKIINEIGSSVETLEGCAGNLSRTVTFIITQPITTATAVQFEAMEGGWLVIGLSDNSSKTTEAYLTIGEEVPPTIAAKIDIQPDTLNLDSKGQWITAYIQLPAGYDVATVDCESIKLQDSIAAASCDRPLESVIGDHNSDGIADFMVKFDRATVQALLTEGKGELVVKGALTDGTSFIGSDTITVIASKSWLTIVGSWLKLW